MSEIKICINFTVKTPDCKMETIIACYKKLSILILAKVAMEILIEFATRYMNEKTQPFVCGECGDNSNFIFKTKCGKDTTLTTITKLDSGRLG